MASVLETAKEATYAAVGLNVLFLDEVAERTAEARKQFEARTADNRKQLEAQLDIAREHGRKAQADFQSQAETFTSNLKQAVPFDVDAAAERIKSALPGDIELDRDSIQARVQPIARKGFEMVEPMWKRVAEIAPAPLDGYVTDGVERVRKLVVDEPVVEAPAKPAAKKTTARKTTAKKAPARKTTAKKAPARKAAAKK